MSTSTKAFLALLAVLLFTGFSFRNAAPPPGLTSPSAIGVFLNNTLPTSTPPQTGNGSAPLLLSQTGAFTNLATLETTAGIIPYDMIEPFWSDGAAKTRWMAIPNDGTHDTAAEKIQFSNEDPWIFPVGSVLIKHFELGGQRLETRFEVLGTDNVYYYLTYKWNDAETDAELLYGGFDETITVGGVPQTWHYPSITECQDCHTPEAGHVLGPKTRHLNKEIVYPSTGISANQLVTLSSLGIIDESITDVNAGNYLAVAAKDDMTASLEYRARSYIDVNCSNCHNPSSINGGMFDARITTPLDDQGIIYGPVIYDEGLTDPKVVIPQDVAHSMMHHRMNSLTPGTAMPPLAKSVVDADGVQLIADWINSLTPSTSNVPVALFSASPLFGTAPLNVNFDASSSYDLDGDPLTYSWDFGDGNTATGLTTSHTYQSVNTYQATLTVSDGQYTDFNSVTITVTNQPSNPSTVSFTDKTSLLSGTNYSGVPMAISDMNGDGKDDIIRLGNARDLNIQYQGSPDGAFTSYSYGIVGSNNQWSICVGDYDKNGYNDILTGGTSGGIEVFSNNNGSNSFTSQTLPSSNIFIQGSNFVDIDNDSWADIFACDDNAESRPYKNNTDGTFSYVPSLIGTATTPTSDNSGNYASMWTDYDNDGDLDLYISKCRIGASSSTDPRRINMLWQNDGSNNFTEVALQANLKFGAQSWVSDFGDIDNDGDLDCIVINHHESSNLMRNNGNGTFTDITAGSGLFPSLQGSNTVGIQSLFRDFNNDGYIDLIVTGADHFLFYNDGDGTFTEAANPFNSNQIESLAVGDLNGDGFVDVYAGYAQIYNSPSSISDRLFMNDGNANNYIAVELEGTVSNINGIGARIELYGSWGKQIREVRAGEGYGISNSLTRYFGIGSATDIDNIIVRWPSGIIQEINNPASNQHLVITETTCSTIGQSCNDQDDCTINDSYDAACNCVGTYVDNDNDNVCAANDPDDTDPCIPNACPSCTDVTITIVLDDYPAETTFELQDGNGVTLLSGGPYAVDFATITETICLDDGCYDFIISDTYGDGICCGYGDGSYTLTDSYGNTLGSGGQFTNSETTNFCLSPPCNDTGLSCDDGDDCTVGETYDNNCNCTGGSLLDENNNGICDLDETCDGQLPDSESFESNLGNWVQGTGDDLDWTRDSGGTPSNNTGPESGSDGNWYMYIEASDPNYPNKTASLESTCYDLSGYTSAELSFSYHMYGSEADMNLVVQVSTNQGGTWSSDLWTRTGNHGNQWYNTTVDLSAYVNQSIMVRFFGTTGGGWQGDIAIDLAAITASNICPDADSDGICDADDQCPGQNDNLIGTACDDGDACTTGETYDANCNCSGGVFQDADSDGVCDADDQCPGQNDNLIGTVCDDGDDCTTGETYDNNCNCSGGVFQDADSDGVCDTDDVCPGFDDNLIGTACDDGDACTTGETYDVDCNCSGGVFQDADSDGVCDADDQCPGQNDNLIGTACDDGDACTTGETYDNNCNCSGGVFQDADSDGVCDTDDVCPDFDDNLIGTACDDGNDCTAGETYDIDCNCSGGVFQDADSDGVCDADDVCPDFDDNLIGTACDDGNECTIGETYDSNCNCSGGILEDADNDGVCDDDDVCPGFDDNLIGTACDDGNDCTTGETYDNNCNCSGGVFQDADNDGVCDVDDACPGFNDNLIGTACDDGNECTIGETYDSNCNCSGGILQDADNDGVCDDDDVCPGFDDNLIGTACDDGDACTTGETYDNNCNCSGGVFQDADSDGVCDADDACPGMNDNLIGTACDDGDACTIGETYDSNCNCSGGVFQDADSDGVCDADDACPDFDDNLIGTACDDGDACTVGETYDSNCNCSGGVFQDTDSDGVCDADDACPGMNDNLIGTACDDGDACTIGETYDSNCNCSGGVFQDADSDGVCDADDACPGFDDNLIGTACDDGDACTAGETYDSNCNCSGGVFQDADSDGVCDADDVCPGFDDSLIGTACDDGDDCTIGETYDIDCNCSGGTLLDENNNGICDLDENCNGQLPDNESFESGLGNWAQGTGDDLNWTRRSGGTPSNNTGPGSAFDGNWYMYVEASNPNYPSKTAYLESICYNLSGYTSANLSFAYHMYGTASNMNLAVQVSTDDGDTWSSAIWNTSGNHGNQWNIANVDLSTYLGQNINLRFVGTTGETWRGDVAIDQVSIDEIQACTNVSLSITFDNYPQETSWSITDANGATVMSGSNYGSEPDGSTLIIAGCLEDGCYDLTFEDSYGDGICCGYGIGSYSLTASNGTVYASGGEFTSTETTNFCISNSLGQPAQNRPQGQTGGNEQLELESTIKEFTLYPNPTRSILNLVVSSNTSNEVGSYHIYDLSGKLLLTGQLDLIDGKTLQQLDISNLEAGSYFVAVEVGGERTYKRFVKI